VPDGKVRYPGEDAMSRPTLRNFLEAMKAFRYNEKENEVVILDYGVSKAEKARIWDSEAKAMVTKSIKNQFRQIGTLRQYIVIPESRWQEYLNKVWAQPEKNSHRKFLSLCWVHSNKSFCFRRTRFSVQQSDPECCGDPTQRRTEVHETQ